MRKRTASPPVAQPLVLPWLDRITPWPAVMLATALLMLAPGCSKKEDKPAADAPKSEAGASKPEVSTPKPPTPLVIEPGSGVGKVRRGMTVQQVLAEIGPPRSTNGNMLVYPRLGIWVGMTGDKVDIFNVHLRKGFTGRTQEGVGIGSTREEVIGAYGQPVPQPPSTREPKPGFEIMNYSKPSIRFFLQDGAVEYIVLDLHKQR
jgi:hypothetical protein